MPVTIPQLGLALPSQNVVLLVHELKLRSEVSGSVVMKLRCSVVCQTQRALRHKGLPRLAPPVLHR